MIAIEALLLVAAISASGETVLLDFSSEHCGPCRQMVPSVQRLETAGYPIRRIDIERSPMWAQQYNVSLIPCFVMVANGREVGRITGATSYDQLVRLYESAGFVPDSRRDDSLRLQSPDRPGDDFALPDRSRPSEFNSPGTRNLYEPTPAVPPGPRPIEERRTLDSAQAIQQLALQATVRLKVEDPDGNSFGTGTIIDVHGDEALIVTCGHIFRDSGGKGRITVDLNVPDGQPVPGHLIAYQAEQRDIGLVSIRPGVPVTAMRVAPAGYRPVRGARVFSVGCDHGQRPTIRESQIASLDKYRDPYVVVAGHPVDGRSGGGLFSDEGLLIGVCNAADLDDDEGLYAALDTIHGQLAQIGQRQLFEASPTAIAEIPPAAPPRRGGEPPANNLRSVDQPDVASANDQDFELLLFVRPRNNPAARTEPVVIDNLSPELVARLQAEIRERSRNVADESTRNEYADPRKSPAKLLDTRNSAGPIVRAQSADR